MSSVACHGLQSCLEPWPKLTATTPYFSPSFNVTWGASVSDSDSDKHLKEKCNNKNEHNTNSNGDQQNKNNDMGGWSFIQALTNSTSVAPKAVAEEKDKPYIHPLVKKRSLTLNQRSLEMCTENLGSETGSILSEDFIIQPLDSDIGKPPTRRREQPNLSSLRQHSGVSSREFPPPLTTISWSDQVQVKTHREGGRLLMKTVRVPCPQAYFQAERVEGRLRLHLSTNYSQRIDPEFDSSVTLAVEEEEEEEEEDDDDDDDDEEEEEIEEIEEIEGEEAEAAAEIGGEVGEEEDDVKYWGWGTNGNDNNNQVEMDNYERGRRRSRCNEGDGHRNTLLLIQEPCCWVASS